MVNYTLFQEQECSQLKKGKSKETQVKSESKGRGATVHASMRTNL